MTHFLDSIGPFARTVDIQNFSDIQSSDPHSFWHNQVASKREASLVDSMRNKKMDYCVVDSSRVPLFPWHSAKSGKNKQLWF